MLVNSCLSLEFTSRVYQQTSKNYSVVVGDLFSFIYVFFLISRQFANAYL